MFVIAEDWSFIAMQWHGRGRPP